MAVNNLRAVADEVIRRAERQGHVVAEEVREELTRAGLDDTLGKDVLALARASLSYRDDGRYYFTPPVSGRVLAEQSQQRDTRSAAARLIEHHRSGAGHPERREQGRIDFVQVVKVVTDDHRTFTLLTRDLSETGVRLIGTRRLLGQKVRVLIPAPEGGTLEFVVRVLWTCPVGEDLVENGGTFVSVGK